MKFVQALAALLLVVGTGCTDSTVTAPPATASGSEVVAVSESAPSTQSSPSSASSVPTGNHDLLLGNPSQAAKDANNYLVSRPAHTMSYNARNGGPNWVAWHLDKSDLGSARRSDFMPDPLLPAAMQIRPTDYRNSGYDRGHVCPSGDRTRDSTLNQQTFVMSNMLPQAPALNQQVWKDLEEYERYLVNSAGQELYIFAGGSGSVERIAKGKVNVPTVCWKIILALPQGNNDLKRIDANTRVIAVAMPNRDQKEIADSRWSDWITTVAQIEKTTGYNFFSNLPAAVQRALESQKDSGRGSRASTDGSGATSQAQRPAPRVVIVDPPAPVYQPQPPSPREAAPEVMPRGPDAGSAVGQSAAVQVWVNTNSGIYHSPGARWYGNTKQGVYMSEAEAQANGYRAARNGQ